MPLYVVAKIVNNNSENSIVKWDLPVEFDSSWFKLSEYVE